MPSVNGTPCWYELGTPDPDGAQTFYGLVLGWTFQQDGSDGFDYRLAAAPDGAMVAGVMSNGAQAGSPPPNWLLYYAVDDCDAASGAARAAGGGVVRDPTDVAGTGRFAVLSDPQGAVFGVLQPDPPSDPDAGRAFDQAAAGHGNWHELMTPHPDQALGFYAGLFGWSPGELYDMGAAGPYQLFRRGDADIGGMMNQGGASVPSWVPYFGVSSFGESVDRVTTAGGTIVHGPNEVPGGACTLIAEDPQGAVFALVGPPDTA
ncbi:MAG: VOC family protein [Thermoleophilia bacterium]